MVEIIAFIFFVSSIASIAVIIGKRMPKLAQMPLKADNSATTFKDALRGWFSVKIKNTPYLKDFNWLDFLQKILLKGRVITLKTENKINNYMVTLRQHAQNQQKKEEALLDNYWHDLKTIVKNKTPLYKRDDKTSIVQIKELELKNDPPTTKIAPSATDTQPLVSRTVMPETPAQSFIAKNIRPKKKHPQKKRKFKDPFSW